MSPPARLLRSDEEQISKIRVALRLGHFAIVVAGAIEWEAVVEFLGLAGSPSFELHTGDDVIAMFASQEASTSDIVTFHLNADAREAMGALNLNRDKLLDSKTSFLLHIPDQLSFRIFVEEAPDCFSVRGGLVILEPSTVMPVQAPPPSTRKEESLLISGEDALSEGQRLLKLGLTAKARQVIDRGIILLAKWPLSPHERSILANLYYFRSDPADLVEQRASILHALHILEPVKDEFKEQYIDTLGQLKDAYGIELVAIQDAITKSESPRTRQTLLLMHALATRDDYSRAKAILTEAFDRRMFARQDSLFLYFIRAQICCSTGKWKEALWLLELGGQEAKIDKDIPFSRTFDVNLAEILNNQGEHEKAQACIRRHSDDYTTLLSLKINCLRGEKEFDMLIDALGNRLSTSRKSYEFEIAAWLILIASKAKFSSKESIQSIEKLLLDWENRTLRSSDPPRQAIDAKLLLADYHLAIPTPRAAADTAQKALDLARWGAPEMVAKCVYLIAVAKLLLNETDLLDELFDEAIHCTEAHHLPGEAARIAGLRLWLAIHRGTGVEEAEKDLEDAFSRSGSVLVQAEVLLRTGHSVGRRDMILRARRIYHGLPWPEREGACLEALGMHDAARRVYKTFGLHLAAQVVEKNPNTPIDS